MLVEQLLVFPGSNGVLFHHDVARAALLDGVAVAGQPLALRADLAAVARALEARVSGYERDKPFLVRPVQPDRQRLHVVVFVQEAGRVVQAHSLPVEVAK